jgi:hypothetical protein
MNENHSHVADGRGIVALLSSLRAGILMHCEYITKVFQN